MKILTKKLMKTISLILDVNIGWKIRNGCCHILAIAFVKSLPTPTFYLKRSELGLGLGTLSGRLARSGCGRGSGESRHRRMSGRVIAAKRDRIVETDDARRGATGGAEIARGDRVAVQLPQHRGGGRGR